MPQVSATSRQVNAYDLASQWLTALGWPNNPQTQRALAAWFMAESSRSGNNVNVVGNNPLNITCSGNCNYRLVGTHKIAVYDTPASGLAAFRGLITGTKSYNYPGIVAAFKSGNGGKAVDAIINSGWVTGGTGPSYWHTVGGKRSNLLQSTFNGIGGGGSTATMPDAILAGSHAVTEQAFKDALAALNIPQSDVNGTGHRLTKDEAQKLTDYLKGKGYDTSGAGIGEGAIVLLILQGLGQPNSLNPGFTEAANQNIADAINGIVTFIGKFVLGGGAVAIGGIMALFGVYLITKEATNTSGPESIVSPVPVFLREK